MESALYGLLTIRGDVMITQIGERESFVRFEVIGKQLLLVTNK